MCVCVSAVGLALCWTLGHMSRETLYLDLTQCSARELRGLERCSWSPVRSGHTWRQCLQTRIAHGHCPASRHVTSIFTRESGVGTLLGALRLRAVTSGRTTSGTSADWKLKTKQYKTYLVLWFEQRWSGGGRDQARQQAVSRVVECMEGRMLDTCVHLRQAFYK